ncbi:MAG: membrane protein insertase YidC [Chitinophagaceae bacterium]
MKLDKNTVIGTVLLVILFVTMFWYNNKQQNAYAEYQQKIKDSTAKAEAIKAKNQANTPSVIEQKKLDSAKNAAKAGTLINAINGKEELTVIENNLAKYYFSNNGGVIKFVELKKYKSFDSSLVKLGTDNDKLGYKINTGNNNAVATNELSFTKTSIEKLPNGDQKVIYALQDSTGNAITHEYIVKADAYMVDWNINVNNPAKYFTNNQLNFFWKSSTTQHERSAKYEKQQVSNICFLENKEFDYISSNLNHKFEKPLGWMSVVQQFFNTTLVAKNEFKTGEVNWNRTPEDSNKVLANIDAVFSTTLPTANTISFPMQMYFGPNDFNILKKQEPAEMERIINFGRDMYAFVRPINKFIIMPVFNFLSSMISNYGWVILLLTVLIRLITAPLMYGSYVSGAKMKVLRPELDTIKKKFGDDQQGFAMEQMKLFREAGVNPLGGCIPALLQIPIFFALYSFFNSAIALRGEAFLWSKDLSSHDEILTWGFNIPGLGSHLSLFTITAVLTSFLISIYNMASTPTQDNPALKYMPYIFPFILFFVFNNLPSALTWYYTVSNAITLLLQFVIQKYIINHDKILAQIEEKRKNPKKKEKSKWQERLEQMQESQRKLQEMKNKAKK